MTLPSDEPADDAFISYRRKGGTEAAEYLFLALENFKPPDGYGAWAPLKLHFDRASEAATTNYRKELARKLDASRALIIVWTELSWAEESVQRFEIEYFRSKHPDRLIVPIVLDGDPYSKVLPKDVHEQHPHLQILDGRIFRKFAWRYRPAVRGALQKMLVDIAGGVRDLSADERTRLHRFAERRRIRQAQISAVVGFLIFALIGTLLGLYTSRVRDDALRRANMAVDPARGQLWNGQLSDAKQTISEGLSAVPDHFGLRYLRARVDRAMRPIAELRRPGQDIRAGEFRPDGSRLRTGGKDGLRIWSSKGEPIAAQPLVVDSEYGIAKPPESYMAEFDPLLPRTIAYSEDVAVVLDDERGRILAVVPERCPVIKEAAPAPKSNTILAREQSAGGAPDNQLRLYDLQTGSVLRESRARESAGQTFAAGEDSYLVRSSVRDMFEVWDGRSGSSRCSFQVPGGEAIVSYSAVGDAAVIRTEHNEFRLVRLTGCDRAPPTITPLGLKCHVSSDCSFSPEYMQLAAGGKFLAWTHPAELWSLDPVPKRIWSANTSKAHLVRVLEQPPRLLVVSARDQLTDISLHEIANSTVTEKSHREYFRVDRAQMQDSTLCLIGSTPIAVELPGDQLPELKSVASSTICTPPSWHHELRRSSLKISELEGDQFASWKLPSGWVSISKTKVKKWSDTPEGEHLKMGPTCRKLRNAALSTTGDRLFLEMMSGETTTITIATAQSASKSRVPETIAFHSGRIIHWDPATDALSTETSTIAYKEGRILGSWILLSGKNFLEARHRTDPKLVRIRRNVHVAELRALSSSSSGAIIVFKGGKKWTWWSLWDDKTIELDVPADKASLSPSGAGLALWNHLVIWIYPFVNEAPQNLKMPQANAEIRAGEAGLIFIQTPGVISAWKSSEIPKFIYASDGSKIMQFNYTEGSEIARFNYTGEIADFVAGDPMRAVSNDEVPNSTTGRGAQLWEFPIFDSRLPRGCDHSLVRGRAIDLCWGSSKDETLRVFSHDEDQPSLPVDLGPLRLVAAGMNRSENAIIGATTAGVVFSTLSALRAGRPPLMSRSRYHFGDANVYAAENGDLTVVGGLYDRFCHVSTWSPVLEKETWSWSCAPNERFVASSEDLFVTFDANNKRARLRRFGSDSVLREIPVESWPVHGDLVAALDARGTTFVAVADRGARYLEAWDVWPGRLRRIRFADFNELTPYIGKPQRIRAGGESAIAVQTETQIFVLDPRTGRTLWSREGPIDDILFAHRGAMLIASTKSGSILIFDALQGNLLEEIPAGAGISSLHLEPGERRLWFTTSQGARSVDISID